MSPHTDPAPPQYLAGHIHEALAQDPRVNQLDLNVSIANGRVFISGDVPTAERQAAITEVVADMCAEYTVCNETTVTELAPAPTQSEQLS